MPSKRRSPQSEGDLPPLRPPRRPTRPTRPHHDGHDGPPPPRHRQKSKRSFGIWIVAAIVIVALGLAFSLLFSGATVSVTPKSETTFIDGTFIAAKENSDFVYEVLTIEQIMTEEVSATESEEATDRASGKIIVYNNHDQNTQRLIKNTRFETPDGLIYRIQESVVVPGQKEEGGALVPGSIEVTVFADEPGEDYNIDRTDFTIPGFKGGERFESFYARSVTPMTGGFTGQRLVVSEDVLDQTKARLQDQLRLELKERVIAEHPDNFLLYDEATFVVFEDLPNVDKENSAEVRVRGILHGVLLPKDQLAAHLASNTLAEYDGNQVMLRNPRNLAVSFIESEAEEPWTAPQITMEISGEAQIDWVFDAETLRTALAGKSKDALQTTLSQYPGIESANASIRPFWQGSFPSDPAKITVTNTLK